MVGSIVRLSCWSCGGVGGRQAVGVARWPPLHGGVWRKWLALLSVVCTTSEAAIDDGLNLKLTVHKRIYDSIKQKVTNLVDKAKQAYYSTKIQFSTTCEQLFQNFNTILGKNSSSPLPSTFDDLPNVFPDYFTEKNPHHQKQFPPNPAACPDNSFVGNPWLTFEPVTDEFCLKDNQSAPAKSCKLDPIPTTLLYENLDILLPTITSYHWHCTTWSEDSRPQTPVEKANTWQNSFENNTDPFPSKILEKVVLHKLLSHLQDWNNLSNPIQPAYRAASQMKNSSRNPLLSANNLTKELNACRRHKNTPGWQKIRSNWTTKQLFSFTFRLPWNLPPFPSPIRLLLVLTTS